MAEKETVDSTAVNDEAKEATTPVRKPRKPRAPKVPVTVSENTEEVKVEEKPKPRPRKPRTPKPVEKPVVAEEAAAPEAPAEEVYTETVQPQFPAESEDGSTIVDDEEGGELTLEELFGEDAIDTSEDDRVAEQEAAEELAASVYANASDEALYATNGLILAPGYWQAWAGKGGRVNVFAWLGLIFAFAFFPLGLLFSGLGWVNAKAVADDKFSRVLSGIGLGLSSFFTFLVLIPLLFGALFAMLRVLWAPVLGM